MSKFGSASCTLPGAPSSDNGTTEKPETSGLAESGESHGMMELHTVFHTLL
jgi:hypothetical protein